MKWPSAGFVMGVAILLATAVHGQQWERFRGPNGSGVSSAGTIPAQWTAEDYNWQTELPGVGHSSPVLWGRKLFLTSGDEATGRRFVLCLDSQTGKQLWQRAFEAPQHRKHQLNSYASATPVVDAQRVYVCWGTPQQVMVMALDQQGRTLWQRDLGPYQGGHGFGVSPIRTANLLVLPNDQAGQSSLIALDCQTGKTVWRIKRESKSAYATP